MAVLQGLKTIRLRQFHTTGLSKVKQTSLIEPKTSLGYQSVDFSGGERESFLLEIFTFPGVLRVSTSFSYFQKVRVPISPVF